MLAVASVLHCRDNSDLGVDIPADLNARAIERIQDTPLQYPVRFVITGDVHPPGYVRFAGMSEQINALEPPPLFVIIVGDFTGTGTIVEYKDYTLVLDNFDPPVISVAGNREQYHAAGLSTFQLVVGPEDFFFDYDQYRFIGLNSSRRYNYGLDDGQLDWLDERLSELPAELAFIFMHHSVFPQSRGGERYFSILDNPL
jgi:3',5'-cyclic AMP phosphodiesterase CpdA